MRITLDKQAHCLGGYALAATFFSVSIWFSLAIVIVVGISKEMYDQRHPQKHTAEFMDAVATIIGGTAACIIMSIVEYLK